MQSIQTYHIMVTRLQQVVGNERITRIRTMAWLQSGIFHSRSVQLTRIASTIPGRAKKLSIADRLRGLLNNGHIRVRAWYRAVAESLLQAAAQSGAPIRLVLDGSKVGSGHQLLMVALTFRRRAIPIAWTWVRCQRGHSSGKKQCALLAYVQQLVLSGANVLVIGDSEFAPLLPLRERWHWSYAIRQKGRYLWRHAETDTWHRCDSLVTTPGQQRWVTGIHLTKAQQVRCNLFALWQPGHADPWLIATNLPTAAQTRRHYTRRMWIEALFGDFKRHGFDLESSRLKHFLRLSRLTLAVALLYVMLCTFGSQPIKNGNRGLVDRPDRRDLSIFRIGCDMLARCLMHGDSVSIRHIPYLS